MTDPKEPQLGTYSESEQEAWARGYTDGIEDQMPDNPYAEGTPERKAWDAGFDDGSADC